MGRVADILIERLRRHLRERRIVVWYDGQGVYADFVSDLTLDGVRVFRYAGSFFRLRHEIEPFLDDLERGQVLVYVDRRREETDHALIEADVTGVVWEPGAASRSCNTRLGVVSREALQGRLAEAVLERVCDEANAGKRTLSEMDALDGPAGASSVGRLALVYETATPREIALLFLTDPTRDRDIEARDARGELEDLLRVVFGFRADAGASLLALRTPFARHLILSELTAAVPEALNEALRGASRALGRSEVEAVRELLDAYRDSDAKRPLYMEAAAKVEESLSISRLGVPPADLLECDALPGVDLALLDVAEKEIAEGRFEEPLRWHAARRERFWARFDARIAHRWAAVEAAARVVAEATRIGAALRQDRMDLPSLVKAYAEGAGGEAPWCRLDRYHRILCRTAVEPGLGEGFDRAFTAARRMFDEVCGALADCTLSAISRPGGAQFGPELRQTSIFAREIVPRLDQGRVAYVWVDAMRYEMAEDLASSLPGEVALRPALAVVPSITKLGMAALLPGAEKEFEVVEKGGAAAVRIGERVMADRAERVQFLKDALDGVVDVKLEDLTRGRRAAKDKAAGARLLVVTSQEIDQFGTPENEPVARRIMETVLGDLRRAIRTLAEWGFTEIVVTADHGFLYGEKAGDDLLVDPPGGEKLEIHRRVWMGRGGADPAGTTRLPLSAFGVKGAFDVVLPGGLSVFRTGGGRTYFHGGATLQERVVPVLTVRVPSQAAEDSAGEAVTIEIDAERGIRNRIFTVAVTYQSLLRPRCRVAVVARSGDNVVAEAATSEYGYFAGTREIEMETGRRNVVTLALSSHVSVVKVEVRDAEIGRVLGSTPDVAVRLGI